MGQMEWMDTLVQVKRMGNLLSEVQDLSQQLAEAMDRGDQVSIEMLVYMRREPIENLQEVERILREQTASLPDEETRQRLAALLGGAPAEREEDRMLAELVAMNRRRLDRVLALDRVLNQKMSREKSVYP